MSSGSRRPTGKSLPLVGCIGLSEFRWGINIVSSIGGSTSVELFAMLSVYAVNSCMNELSRLSSGDGANNNKRSVDLSAGSVVSGAR